jgi:CheY-like chemotaxis protein
LNSQISGIVMLSPIYSPSNSIRSELFVPNDIRALLLDDSTFDRARIRRLSGGTKLPIHLDEVGTIEELDCAVHEEDYDVILVDYRLPIGDGMIALDHIQQSQRNRNAGKIMITGNEALGTAVDAMRAGCHDFLSKTEINVDVLKQAVLNALARARDGKDVQPTMSHGENYRALIREGIVAAFGEADIQDRIVSGLSDRQQRLLATGNSHSRDYDPDDLIVGLSDTDEFLFH